MTKVVIIAAGGLAAAVAARLAERDVRAEVAQPQDPRTPPTYEYMVGRDTRQALQEEAEFLLEARVALSARRSHPTSPRQRGGR